MRGEYGKMLERREDGRTMEMHLFESVEMSRREVIGGDGLRNCGLGCFLAPVASVQVGCFIHGNFQVVQYTSP